MLHGWQEIEWEESVRKFYHTAAEYIAKKLPISVRDEHKLHLHAEVFDLSVIQKKSINSVQYFLDKFPVLREQMESRDQLHDEFLHLQVEELPASVTEESDAGNRWNAVGKISDHSANPKWGKSVLFWFTYARK